MADAGYRLRLRAKRKRREEYALRLDEAVRHWHGRLERHTSDIAWQYVIAGLRPVARQYAIGTSLQCPELAYQL